MELSAQNRFVRSSRLVALLVQNRSSARLIHTMDSTGNSTEPVYQFPNLGTINGTGFCRNFGNNTTLFDSNGSMCERADFLNKGSTPMIIAIVIAALYSIVCVLGLVGNVLVMYVIVR